MKKKKLKFDPTERLKSPKVEKKTPEILTKEEVELLLQEPKKCTTKMIRDRAMVELLYETGIRSSELVSLKLSSLNLELGYIVCKGERQERVIPFGEKTGQLLKIYLEESRQKMLREENDVLFVNRSGKQMTRQGFWKLIKGYAKEVGIQREITPHMIRCSFAIHMLQMGASFQKVSERLGKIDYSLIESYRNTCFR